MRFQGTGLIRVDPKTSELHHVTAFVQPLIPRSEPPCCDKNWGMFESDGVLYIFYTILPYLTVFKLGTPETIHAATLVHSSYLTEETQSWLAAFVGLEMSDVRISGHPILYRQYPQTLLMLVHHNWRKHGGSKHWAVQLEFDPLASRFVVVAVSDEPVLDHERLLLHKAAVLNVIAVGSYHIHDDNLLILYGEGDKYAAYHEVSLCSINWVHLNTTSVLPWTGGPTVTLGDKMNSITYSDYKSLVW